jgi:lysocardiolipin and lysophospholipid acyltransferase
METGKLRQRQKPATVTKAEVDTGQKAGHPGGDIKHGGATQILRLLLVIVYFMSSCFSYACPVLVGTFYCQRLTNDNRIVATQFIGVPLYWINRDLYYAYMALTKQSFGIFVTTLTQWWSPTVVRISGDASVAGEVRKTKDGRVECHFPDRMVMIANHQVCMPFMV